MQVVRGQCAQHGELSSHEQLESNGSMQESVTFAFIFAPASA